MANFSLGDVVQLKSGGPLMTVSSELQTDGYHPGTYYCEWFIKDKLESGNFQPEVLKKID